MSTIDDISNWVISDMLHRSTDTDVQSVARDACLNFYKVLCAKIPFDELQFTSGEFPLVANQDSYTIGSDWILVPALRAISNIRLTFDSSNKRRLRRSHVRVYDSLSFTTSNRPATYARWGNTLQLNPPPDSSSYTMRFRFWGRPPVGKSYTITSASWAGNVVTFTIGANTVTAGHSFTVLGASPNSGLSTGYNGVFTSTGNPGSTVTAALTTNPGAFVGGGILTDTTDTSFQNTILITPVEWDELLKWETLYRVYYALDQRDKAMELVQPAMMPRQSSPKKTIQFETGIIPRLWNDLLTTMSQQENTDEDFSINPVIRAYSMR